MRDRLQTYVRASLTWLKSHPHHVVAGVLLAIWCIPYFVTGNNVEWGDFTFFAQGAEAIRNSILAYHQFPWWNPWVAGGVPLYANPQFGVFSLQTLFGLFFGAVAGLKITAAIFTVGGYASMFILARRYFKISAKIAAVIALLWVFNSFFVSHIPSHFTFLWYFLAPLFVYLSLTVKNWRGGLALGGLFTLMGLAEIHYSFLHIAIICAIILVVRLVRGKTSRKQLALGLLAAAAFFVVIAGHRALFTLQNVHDFPRIVADPPAKPWDSILAVTLPFFGAHKAPYPYPNTPFGWGETTATFGLCASIALALLIGWLLYRWRHKPKIKETKELRYGAGLLGVAIAAFAIGVGAVVKIAPYSLIKHLPILSGMRVASRWFIWYELAALLFMGYMLWRIRPSRLRTVAKAFLVLGVAELFVLGFGYQFMLFGHKAVTAPKPITAYQFEQGNMFGDTRYLPTGDKLPDDGNMPHVDREYEATTFNLGTIQANDALVDLRGLKTPPHCTYAQGCPFVLSGNAKLMSWSPNKVVLMRTGVGPIRLNMNDSNYFTVNGVRSTAKHVAEPYGDLTITLPDSTQNITIEVQPSASVTIKGLLTK
ncbi:MAG TPA: hypothetical protein VLG40_03280 [Candidatus Saccharimonas sp.]|nr:hypothetical protein [Candidatus Saccharimonas sp.]